MPGAARRVPACTTAWKGSVQHEKEEASAEALGPGERQKCSRRMGRKGSAGARGCADPAASSDGLVWRRVERQKSQCQERAWLAIMFLADMP